MDEPRKRLASKVPASVVEVCRRLREAGFQAYTVGGAVRDALLGREPGDWDVTTSAHPDEVMALFKRTIPTGIEHGTVTVMIGRGEQRIAVEVTTFRGEGAYSDSRRPDHVIFGVPLEEDLARRDFVVNAMAYDPVNDELCDPFGGEADLQAQTLRAVGNPTERFAEDGLRVMRAVRFAATLGFEIDPATEAALEPALDALARVSKERIRVELFKLLAADHAEKALEVARRRGVLAVALPEVGDIDYDTAVARMLLAPCDPPLRIGILLVGLSGKRVDAAMRTLTLSNEDRARVVRIVAMVPNAPEGDPGLRRLLGEAGRDDGAADLVMAWRACGTAEIAARAERILAAGDPLTVGDLAVRGGELISALSLAPGPEIGRLQRELLSRVLEDPSLNEPTRLLELARSLL